MRKVIFLKDLFFKSLKFSTALISIASFAQENAVVINKWEKITKKYFIDYTNYSDWLPQKSNINLLYIVDKKGENSYDVLKLGVDNSKICTVGDIHSLQELSSCMEGFISKFGKINFVIPTEEWSIETAAQLRERFDIQNGMRPSIAELFRDKLIMRQKGLSSGIPQPRFCELDIRCGVKLVKETGFPILIKPRSGAMSKGIEVINNYEEFSTKAASYDKNEYLIEEFIKNKIRIYHTDGVVFNDKILHFSSAYYYPYTNLEEFQAFLPGGEVSVSDPIKIDALRSFTNKVIAALGLKNSSFHLEIIEDQETGKQYFLEIGARFGGGLITESIFRQLGVHLPQAHFLSSLNIDPSFLGKKSEYKTIGNLMLPINMANASVVKGISFDADSVNGLFEYQLPEIGANLSPFESRKTHVPVFFFHGASSEEVEASINQTIQMFKLELIEKEGV